MNLEIDDDIVNKIIVAEMKKDFISQQEQIAELLGSGKPLADYQIEDLWNFRDTASGIATVLKYYMYRPDAEKFISDNTVPIGSYHG